MNVSNEKRKLNARLYFSGPNGKVTLVYLCAVLYCIFIHLMNILFYCGTGALPVGMADLVGAIVCIAISPQIFKKRYDAVSCAIFLDIILHSITATVYLGWDYGFYLNIVGIIPLMFFCRFKKTYTPFACSMIAGVVFVFLKIYTVSAKPLLMLDLSGGMHTLLYLFNVFSSIIPMIVFSWIYSEHSKKSTTALSEKNRNLKLLAGRDPLTGLLNRRSMAEKLETAIFLRETQGIKFSLIICDIDDFKKVNDLYGHDCGDYILQTIAFIMTSFWGKDIPVCRWGGEEILILLPEPVNVESVVEELRKEIEHYNFIYNGIKIKITMTFGICPPAGELSVSDMILCADKNLYAGKRSGKNCVVAMLCPSI
ncbi:MAG: GGDEF domain-containing protein [Oscillospiraceae bacterium]|nr:GGDEF domain-containing protein [Oscillospiraceae bacterium]